MADMGLEAVWIPAGDGDPSPTGGPAGDDAPVVVVLHGRGDSAAGFTWMPEAFGTGYGYLLLNAPDAYFGGRSWYGFDDDRDPDILRSRALLLDALDVLHDRGVPSGRTVLFGFSQGCLMAVDVGLRCPRPLGAVMGFSGQVAFADRAADERTDHADTFPWRITHGTRDEMLPVEVTRAQVEQLRAAGIPVEWSEYPDSHTIGPDNLRDARTWLHETVAPA